jgi:hypothetical protein
MYVHARAFIHFRQLGDGGSGFVGDRNAATGEDIEGWGGVVGGGILL